MGKFVKKKKKKKNLERMKLAEYLSVSRQEKRNYINYFNNKYPLTEGFPNGSAVRNPPVMQEVQETWV